MVSCNIFRSRGDPIFGPFNRILSLLATRIYIRVYIYICMCVYTRVWISVCESRLPHPRCEQLFRYLSLARDYVCAAEIFRAVSSNAKRSMIKNLLYVIFFILGNKDLNVDNTFISNLRKMNIIFYLEKLNIFRIIYISIIFLFYREDVFILFHL